MHCIFAFLLPPKWHRIPRVLAAQEDKSCKQQAAGSPEHYFTDLVRLLLLVIVFSFCGRLGRPEATVSDSKLSSASNYAHLGMFRV